MNPEFITIQTGQRWSIRNSLIELLVEILDPVRPGYVKVIILETNSFRWRKNAEYYLGFDNLYYTYDFLEGQSKPNDEINSSLP